MSGNTGPNIVDDGLMLHLDAANIKSYNSGLTWRDLSKRNFNGTLINGPTYSSDRGGSLVFDGSDDYVSITPITAFGTGDYCIETILKITTIKSNQYFFDFGINSCALQYYIPGVNLVRFLTQTTTIKDTTYTLNQNQIYSISVVRNSGTGYLFINGVQVSFWFNDLDNYSSNNIKLGNYGGTGIGLAGNIYSFKIYNRALSNAQVAQNFNAVRNRFGI